MWARTLCPLSSSTRKKAFGSDSTTVPSISMAPSFLGMSSALRSVLVVRAWARLGLGGKPAPPGSRPCWLGQRDEITGKGSEGSPACSHARAPGRQPRGAQRNGPQMSVLDPRHQREPPTYKTLLARLLFPGALRAADHRPDPGDRDQRPPRE